MNDLGFEEAVYGLGESIVIAVPDTADRRFELAFALLGRENAAETLVRSSQNRSDYLPFKYKPWEGFAFERHVVFVPQAPPPCQVGRCPGVVWQAEGGVGCKYARVFAFLLLVLLHLSFYS